MKPELVNEIPTGVPSCGPTNNSSRPSMLSTFNTRAFLESVMNTSFGDVASFVIPVSLDTCPSCWNFVKNTASRGVSRMPFDGFCSIRNFSGSISVLFAIKVTCFGTVENAVALTSKTFDIILVPFNFRLTI